MQIYSIEVSMLHLPLKKPFSISYTSYKYMTSIIVKIETTDGLIGYGEGTPDQHVTGETAESVYCIIKNNLAPILIGENPANIEQIHDLMHKTIIGVPTAKAAIDIACFDLLGKHLNVPIYALLGGRIHDYFSLTHVLSIDTPQKMIQETLNHLEKGYKSFKIKAGKDSKKDVERIKSVSKAVNNQAKLCVDVNQGWETPGKTLSVISQLQEVKLEWIEQPVIANNVEDLKAVKKKSNILIMADEAMLGIKDLQEIIKKKAVNKINIKLMKCGGIYPALKLTMLAGSSGIDCQIGSMVESSIGSAAGYHVAFSKKIVSNVELTGPLKFSQDIGNLYYETPYIKLNKQPGLGVDINDITFKKLTQYREVVY